MPSEITLNTIENRSPFHKRLAENVIKYISCGRLLLKWQQKKVQKCETLSGCMCFFDEGGLKLRINIQGTCRVKMMIILQTNVIVSNFFAQDAPQFCWDSIPAPLSPFNSSSLSSRMTVLSPRLSESNSGCVFIRDLGYNPVRNSRKRIGQHSGPFGCKFPRVGTTPGPLWTTENRGYYPGRKAWEYCCRSALREKLVACLSLSSIFVKNIVKYSIFVLPAVYNDQITHRAFVETFLKCFQSFTLKGIIVEFCTTTIVSTKSRLNNNFALLMSFTGRKLILPLNVTLLNC